VLKIYYPNVIVYRLIMRVGITTYELCGNVENGLEGEPSATGVEEILEARSEKFHYQSVVLSAWAKVIHFWYTLCALWITSIDRKRSHSDAYFDVSMNEKSTRETKGAIIKKINKGRKSNVEIWCVRFFLDTNARCTFLISSRFVTLIAFDVFVEHTKVTFAL